MLLKFHRQLGIALVLGLGLSAAVAEAAKRIKPGWNLFKPAQDIQLGQDAAKDIEKQVEVAHDPQLTNYVAGIGKRLADAAQGEDYPYSFKVVADPSINAFALPGGPIYVHSGLIAAADNEAQLAGVLAHEVSHVALRHSTNRASKAYAFQIPLVLAAGTIQRKGGLLGALSGIGLNFGLNSLFLRYSRNAEKDADILGARMLSEVGYEPVEMANFFEKLEQQSGGRSGPQFFSDHPNPGNRVRYVTAEVRDLPVRRYTRGDTKHFREMKARARRIKPTKKTGTKTGEEAPGSAAQSPGGCDATSGVRCAEARRGNAHSCSGVARVPRTGRRATRPILVALLTRPRTALVTNVRRSGRKSGAVRDPVAFTVTAMLIRPGSRIVGTSLRSRVFFGRLIQPDPVMVTLSPSRRSVSTSPIPSSKSSSTRRQATGARSLWRSSGIETLTSSRTNIRP